MKIQVTNSLQQNFASNVSLVHLQQCFFDSLLRNGTHALCGIRVWRFAQPTSGDMSPAESVGAIMQEKVEEALLAMDPRDVTRKLLLETVN